MVDLSALDHDEQVATILTASPEAIQAAQNTLRSRARTQPGGRPKKTQPCPFCALALGTREMRAHQRQCPERQKAPTQGKSAATPALQVNNQ